MEEIKGIIEEVYIPVEDNQDVMFSKKIGFIVKCEDEVINLIEEQDIYNANILKGDKVIIKKQVISEKLFIDIEKIEGEENE